MALYYTGGFDVANWMTNLQNLYGGGTSLPSPSLTYQGWSIPQVSDFLSSGTIPTYQQNTPSVSSSAVAPTSSGMTDAAYQQYIAYQQQIADRQYALAVAQMEQQKLAEQRAWEMQMLQYQAQFPQLYTGLSDYPTGDGIISPSVPVSNTPVSTETLQLLKALEPAHTILYESPTVGTVISSGAQQGLVPDTFNIGPVNCAPTGACTSLLIPINGIGAGAQTILRFTSGGELWYCDGDTPISPINGPIEGLKVIRRLVIKQYSSSPTEYKAAIETAVSSGSIPATESAQTTVMSGTDYHALGYQIGETVKQLVPVLVEQYLEAKYGSV